MPDRKRGRGCNEWEQSLLEMDKHTAKCAEIGANPWAMDDYARQHKMNTDGASDDRAADPRTSKESPTPN